MTIKAFFIPSKKVSKILFIIGITGILVSWLVIISYSLYGKKQLSKAIQTLENNNLSTAKELFRTVGNNHYQENGDVFYYAVIGLAVTSIKQGNEKDTKKYIDFLNQIEKPNVNKVLIVLNSKNRDESLLLELNETERKVLKNLF